MAELLIVWTPNVLGFAPEKSRFFRVTIVMMAWLAAFEVHVAVVSEPVHAAVFSNHRDVWASGLPWSPLRISVHPPGVVMV